jgi:hypothetical protein
MAHTAHLLIPVVAVTNATQVHDVVAHGCNDEVESFLRRDRPPEREPRTMSRATNVRSILLTVPIPNRD